MPRLSAEQRAMHLLRSGLNPPRPPAHLDRMAAVHWKTIVQSRAPDYFDGASRGMLGIYCAALAEADRVARALTAEPVGSPAAAVLAKNFAALSGTALSLARQLRLTKTSADRRSGHHDERSPPPDTLLGGAIPLRR